MAERAADRVEVETAAAAAWLAADEPAAALPHGARAHAELVPDVAAELAPRGADHARRSRVAPARVARRDPRVSRPRRRSGRRAVEGSASFATGSRSPPIAPATPNARARRAAPARRLTSTPMPDAARAHARRDARPGAAPVRGSRRARRRSRRCRRPRSKASPASRSNRRRARAPMRCIAPASCSAAPIAATTRCAASKRRCGSPTRTCPRSTRSSSRGASAAISNASRVILGRKVAATARHPQRQKPLLSRLGDLQDQLGRPDVALATHQRALEIDPTWRPSLRYVTQRARARRSASSRPRVGSRSSPASCRRTTGVDLAIVARERQLAARRSSELVAALDDAQLEAVRAVARAGARARRARLRAPTSPSRPRAAARRSRRAASRRACRAPRRTRRGGSCAQGSRRRARCRCAMPRRARAPRGKLEDAFASLEAANHVSPGDHDVLRELVELAHRARRSRGRRASISRSLADLQTGARKGDTLLAARRHLLRPARGRAAARASDARRRRRIRLRSRAATRRCACSRRRPRRTSRGTSRSMRVTAIEPQRRTGADIVLLASALVRAGTRRRCGRASIEDATATGKFDDGGILLAAAPRRAVAQGGVARNLDERADAATRTPRPTRCAIEASGPVARDRHRREPCDSVPTSARRKRCRTRRPQAPPIDADREQLLAAQRDNPDDPERCSRCSRTSAIANRGCAAKLLERVARDSHGRAQAIALHELALLARGQTHDPIRAAALWTKAHRVDPSYAPVWMPLADALAGADEIDLARELYEQIAASTSTTSTAARWARERADALGHDDAVVSGEIGRAAEADAAAEPTAEPSLARRARARRARATGRTRSRSPSAPPKRTPPTPTRSSCSSSSTSRPATSPRRREAIGRQLVLVRRSRSRARAVAPPREALSRCARPRCRGVSLPQGSARVRAGRSGDRVSAAHRGDGARRVGARRVAALSRDRRRARRRAIAARSTSSSR